MTSESESETTSAGEFGKAGEEAVRDVEVIVGKIPLEDDPSTLQWSVRCSEPNHDLLGHFGSQNEAEGCRDRHLKDEHQGG